METKNKGAIKTQRQFEKEEQMRLKTKEYFITRQINNEVSVFILRLLGFSAARSKELVRQWTTELRQC